MVRTDVVVQPIEAGPYLASLSSLHMLCICLVSEIGNFGLSSVSIASLCDLDTGGHDSQRKRLNSKL